MKEYLLKAGVSEEEIEKIRQDAVSEIAEAVDFAENHCSEPPMSALYEDVYADGEIII
jgi:pyruvate dehydrogenase E1 component alpha subunit